MSLAILPSGPQLSTKYVLTGPDGTRAVFNDPTDPDFVGALTEVTGMDSPEVRENGENIAGFDGGVHGNFYYGRRPMTLTGTIYNVVSNEDRNRKVTKLIQASNAMRADATLEWTPEGGEPMFIKVRRQQPLRITGGWTKDFQLALIAADPRFYSVALTEQLVQLSAKATTKLITGMSEPKGVAVSTEFIYWCNEKTNTIGRAKIDGTEVNQNFITGASAPVAIAIDSGHIYWANKGTDKIGRATLAGTEVNQAWITHKGSNKCFGIAVDSGHIYFGLSPESWIARANINGTELNEKFIEVNAFPGLKCNGINGVAVNATSIFWGEERPSIEGNTIGKATIAGAEVKKEIAKAKGIILDICIGTSHVYWTTQEANDVIGRCDFDGKNCIKAFLEGSRSPTSRSEGIAVAGGKMYWTNEVENTLGTLELTAGTLGVPIINKGSFESFPVLVVTGPFATFQAENLTTEESFIFDEEHIAGEEIWIDMLNRTVMLNQLINKYGKIEFAFSKWWALMPGENILRLTATGEGGHTPESNNTKLFPLWRSAWI